MGTQNSSRKWSFSNKMTRFDTPISSEKCDFGWYFRRKTITKIEPFRSDNRPKWGPEVVLFPTKWAVLAQQSAAKTVFLDDNLDANSPRRVHHSPAKTVIFDENNLHAKWPPTLHHSATITDPQTVENGYLFTTQNPREVFERYANLKGNCDVDFLSTAA